MIETPTLVRTTAQPIAVIHVVVSREQIRNVMGPTIRELLGAVAAQGIAPSGPWFTHHLRRPSDTFEFEAGVPVATTVVAAGRMTPGVRPAMRMARTVHHGPYEGLADAWGEFLDWIEESGHAEAGDLWETYLVGPQSTPEPSQWRTELMRPLLG